ncbi:ankyrin repeat domain-containing protein [archaeon]|nr:MAG: ankyrin repeat domain-containing protein [archaeon]
MFRFNKSIDNEMKEFTSLMKADPDQGRELFMMGQEVVTLAGKGSYRKFCEQSMKCVSSEGFPSIYFISKAFVASCVSQHLLLAAFVLDNGYSINSDVGPNALLDCLRADSITDDDCVPIVEFLHKYQCDFNRQEDKTYLAPIHIAIEKQFVNTVQALVACGADVNIVAANDVMPLNMAVSLSDSESKNQLVDLLQRK